MAYASRLCNPTPWKVELPWDRGQVIVIPEFGYADLTSQQMDDYKPGKPGSAEVRATLDYYGLFLLDTDRTYDAQALDALRKSRKARKDQYDAAVQRLQDNRAAANMQPNAEALEDTLRMMGQVEIREKVKALDEAITKFTKVVAASGDSNLRAQLDPARTVFVLDPPREFPSVAAMEFFLDKNPAIREKHEASKNKGPARGIAAMSDAQKFLKAENKEQDGQEE